MTEISFSSDEKQRLVALLQTYFDEEMGQELGRFEAEFLLDFIARELGPRFYNQGIADAHSLVTSQLEGIGDALYALGK